MLLVTNGSNNLNLLHLLFFSSILAIIWDMMQKFHPPPWAYEGNDDDS